MIIFKKLQLTFLFPETLLKRSQRASPIEKERENNKESEERERERETIVYVCMQTETNFVH